MQVSCLTVVSAVKLPYDAPLQFKAVLIVIPVEGLDLGHHLINEGGGEGTHRLLQQDL